ncbi:MAG: phage tail sheath subtilisin-like domain-containing protein [Pseudomonadota bacterium]
MPEYLAPGVYVEETSFRARSIQGVGTSTTGFVGLARKGPTDGLPELVTSFGEFERMYGGLDAVAIPGANTDTTNYMAYAARAFFNEGGSRLYISRVFLDRAGGQAGGQAQSPEAALGNSRFASRHPGSAYDGAVRVTERTSPASTRALETAPIGSLVRVGDAANPTAYHVREANGWRAFSRADANSPWTAGDLAPTLTLNEATDVLITVDVEIVDADEVSLSYEGLGLDANHPRAMGRAMPAAPTRRSDLIGSPYVFTQGDTVAPQLHTLLMADPPADPGPTVLGAVTANPDGSRTRSLPLTGGHDGRTAALEQWQGALDRLNDWDDIAIVAAPGASAFAATAQAVQNALITHAERSRFRIAVLDPEQNLDLAAIRLSRGRVDSTYAALYYPWIVITNPQARPGNESIRKEVALPPSGHICGIYARNDALRGVWKTPANEVVREAIRFEREINHGQQEVLNPLGINCLRSFSGRGNRVYGGRLATSDREVVYVSDRRYLNYLKRSIDVSMQWAVFEPNGSRLWANIRDAVSSFLYTEWRNGALLGSNPEQAFFVRCDRSTMTQADLDNGRMICEVGVAIIKPAEFVIFRIGQKTADARN